MINRSSLIHHATSEPTMFRITRGHSVQHIHFPLPVYGRDLDDVEGEPSAAPQAPAAESTTPPAAARPDADEASG